MSKPRTQRLDNQSSLTYCAFSPSALQPDDSCLYHGIQIDSGDIFRPTDIIEDFQMHNNSVRDECIECRCEVSQSLN